jgi:hypothetical protein
LEKFSAASSSSTEMWGSGTEEDEDKEEGSVDCLLSRTGDSWESSEIRLFFSGFMFKEKEGSNHKTKDTVVTLI